MAHFERPLHQQLAHRLGQLQQAQQVGDRRAAAPDGLGRLLVGHAEFVDEPLQPLSFFDGVEVFTLGLHKLTGR